jgi:hypothetical protein
LSFPFGATGTEHSVIVHIPSPLPSHRSFTLDFGIGLEARVETASTVATPKSRKKRKKN